MLSKLFEVSLKIFFPPKILSQAETSYFIFCLWLDNARSNDIVTLYSRRKSSLPLNHARNAVPDHKTQAQTYLPELRNSFDFEKQECVKIDSENHPDQESPSQENQNYNLVKPSEIRNFVRSNSRHKIDLK